MANKKNRTQSKAGKVAKPPRQFVGTYLPDEIFDRAVDSEGCIRGQAREDFSLETGLPIAA